MAALAKRLIIFLTTSILAVGLVVPAASAGSYENEALALLNQARAAAGLAPVSMYVDLTDDALAWSQHMKSEQALSHNPNLSAAADDWDKLGENVGVGTSIAALHQAFMDSPSHRGNILGDYDYVGIAVVEETPTKLWITVVFMKALRSSAVVDDDPEPYAEQQPATPANQPKRTEATEPAPATTQTPRPVVAAVVERRLIRSVRSFGPIAI